MMRREPDRYQPWAKGMDGGAKNPLGARALYLFKDGKDTLYRIHGTTEPSSIGKAVSSGCIRMLNQDVIDLYRRVPIGTKVIVMGDPALIRAATSPAVVSSTPAGPPSGSDRRPQHGDDRLGDLLLAVASVEGGKVASVTGNQIIITDDGKLRPLVQAILPLEQVKKALELSRSRHVAGKIVLTI